jgi:flavodoxin
MKALVVFYSRTGNTRGVAGTIARELGADLEELVDKRGRKGFLGYLKAGRDAIRKKSAELEPLRHSASDYDMIFVGTPVWASNPAPAVRTFLDSHDLSGKRIALFCTMASGGEEATFSAMRTLLVGSEVTGQLAIAMKKEAGERLVEKVVQWVAQWKDPS